MQSPRASPGELHPAQVLRSGHDVSGAHYPGGVAPHKRMRKPIVRKSVDPNATFIAFVQQRAFVRARAYKAAALPPHSFFKKQMLPPLAFPGDDDLASCVCTKFCRCSTNKQRCPVNCVSWTPEGRRLITGNSVGEFTLWNGLAFNFETILQAHDDAVRAMVWSHNDNWLVTADHGGVIKYWQPSMTNVQLLQGHREAVRSLSFSPTDFKFVSCSDDATVKIWDFERTREERVLTGHGWDVKCVAYHPSRSLLASGSKDNLVKIWDPKSGNSLNTLHGHKNTVFKVAWNANGNWLLTASRDQLIKLYDIRMLKEFATMRGHAREVTSIAWHPWYERLFVSGSYDGSMMYWEVGKQNPLAAIPQAHDTAVWDIQWHPVGHVVATGSNDHSTKFWCRNRPGDPMDDKYNGGATVLNEADAMFAEAGMHVRDGGAAAAAFAAASSAGGSSLTHGGEMLPGMADGAGIRASAINVASFQNFNQRGDGSRGFNGGGRRVPPESYTCNRCGTKGHWIEDCPTKDQQGQQHGQFGQPFNGGARKVPPEGYLCKRCNIPGHYISDCTQPKVPPASYTCHKCRQKGHWKQDCPMDGAGMVAATAAAAIAAAHAAAAKMGKMPPGGGMMPPPPRPAMAAMGGAPPRPPMMNMPLGGAPPRPPMMNIPPVGAPSRPPMMGMPPGGAPSPRPPPPGAFGGMMPPPRGPPPPPHMLAGIKREREDDSGRQDGSGWPPGAPPMAGGMMPPDLKRPNVGPGGGDSAPESRDPRRRMMNAGNPPAFNPRR